MGRLTPAGSSGTAARSARSARTPARRPCRRRCAPCGSSTITATSSLRVLRRREADERRDVVASSSTRRSSGRSCSPCRSCRPAGSRGSTTSLAVPPGASTPSSIVRSCGGGAREMTRRPAGSAAGLPPIARDDVRRAQDAAVGDRRVGGGHLHRRHRARPGRSAGCPSRSPSSCRRRARCRAPRRAGRRRSAGRSRSAAPSWSKRVGAELAGRS